jgi:hypothetical protein
MTPAEDKNDVKHNFYEEVECVFDKFPKYHMTVLLGDFNSKIGREVIFKLTVEKISVKSTMFLNCNIHKYTWTSPNGQRPFLKI